MREREINAFCKFLGWVGWGGMGVKRDLYRGKMVILTHKQNSQFPLKFMAPKVREILFAITIFALRN